MTRRIFGRELLDEHFDYRMADVHTALPAKVLSYDASTQTADLRPQISRYIAPDDDEEAEGARTAEALPDLYKVPVAFPRGGGFHMTFPLAAGDFVLVICSEEPTIAWRAKGREVEPGLDDRHGLNGCFAIPAGYPDTDPIGTAPSASDLELASDNGNTILRLDSSGTITITGNLTVTGDVDSDGEVTAAAGSAATAVTLTGHSHSSGTGPTGPPITPEP